jgi:hypothetical protein
MPLPTESRRRKLNRTAPQPMRLEQRLMFDGAVVATTEAVADAHLETTHLIDKPVEAGLFRMAAANLPPVLAAAQADAVKTITGFANSPTALSELSRLFDGGHQATTADWSQAAGTVLAELRAGSYSVALELRSNSELEGALAAFSASGSNGVATIYLNSDWLALGPTSETVSRVLVEEIGHSLDAAINGQADTAGDEGDAFASRLLGSTTADSQRLTQDDHAVLTLDGKSVAVEEASATFKALYQGTPSA